MMTAKRQLLLHYLILVASVVVCILLRNILVILVWILFACFLRRVLHPFGRYKFRFANYGLPGDVCAVVLWTVALALVILSIYYVPWEIRHRFLLLVLAVVFAIIGVVQMYEEIKLAIEKDRNSGSCKADA